MRKIIDFNLLDGLAKDHYHRLNPKLVKPDRNTGRIYYDYSIHNKLSEFAKTQNPIYAPFYSFLESKLEEITISPPIQLLDLHKNIQEEWLKVDSCLKNLEALHGRLLENVFIYESFRNGNKDSSRNIKWFQSLNLKACPYCNRNWISFVKNSNGNNTLLFDLDHYFPKYKYPWFALSFYNLIPSCTICNQRIKGSEDLFLDLHLHPYLDDFDDIVKFNVPAETLDVFFDKKVKIELEILPRPPRTSSDKDFIRAIEFYQFFNLKNLYDTHLDYIRELLQKRIVYSQKYVNQLKENYGELFQSPDEIPRMLFGNYVLPEQIHERPLAKLTKDLMEDII